MIKTVILVDDLSKVFILDEIMRKMIKGKVGRKIVIDIYIWICIYSIMIESM